MYTINGYNISFVGLQEDYNAKEKMNIFAQYAVDIVEGKINFTSKNSLWKDWKDANMLNDKQALLLFNTVFVQRILLGCLAWHNDNYIGPPTAG